jgi:hypothetical protein
VDGQNPGGCGSQGIQKRRGNPKLCHVYVLANKHLIYNLQEFRSIVKILSQRTREIVVLACKYSKGFGTLIANALKLQALGVDFLPCELKGQSDIM